MSEPDLTPAQQSRRLLRACDRGALATRRRDDDGGKPDPTPGFPYASLVLLAVDHDASPVLLISGLAEHTRDIARDDRVALLVDGTAGLAEPLTGPRVTVLGRAHRTGEPRHRARFLARHPGAAMYADFRDFGFYRIAVERAHIVAGFGRIHWIEGKSVLDDMSAAATLADRENDIVGHMNQDHAEAVALYATRLLGRRAGAWAMTGIDPEGCDLRLEGEVARLEFARRVSDAEQARAELVRLVKQARATA